MSERPAEYSFRIFCAFATFLLGVFLILYDIYGDSQISSFFVFGVEFIAGAYYISQRTFRGFKSGE